MEFGLPPHPYASQQCPSLRFWLASYWVLTPHCCSYCSGAHSRRSHLTRFWFWSNIVQLMRDFTVVIPPRLPQRLFSWAVTYGTLFTIQGTTFGQSHDSNIATRLNVSLETVLTRGFSSVSRHSKTGVSQMSLLWVSMIINLIYTSVEFVIASMRNPLTSTSPISSIYTECTKH